MKRLIFILVAVFLTMASEGQVNQEVISSAGGSKTHGSLTINWTIGEINIPTFTNGSLALTRGFQTQLIVTKIEENLDLLIKPKLYPNPFIENIIVQFQEPLDGTVTVSVLDSQGRAVKSDLIESELSEKIINMQDLSAGIYYLKLTKGKLVNVYKVVKL